MHKVMRKSKKRWIVASAATGLLLSSAMSISVLAEETTGDAQPQSSQLGNDTTKETLSDDANVASVKAVTTSESVTEPATQTSSTASETVEAVKESAPFSKEESVSVESSRSAEETSVTAATLLGLTDEAYSIAKEAGLDLTSLTDNQKAALNKLKRDVVAETGNQMTYKQFEEIAETLVAQDARYAIPYFNAAAIKNMKAATTKDAQTGEVADLDVWDSWPVQDIRTGKVVDWNGYQLVVAMMGIPNTNDNHLYLLYNKFGDNNFDNWKNAGAIFGYNATTLTQQWSGSAVVNSDGSIQLYYTHVDTSDDNSNNQQLATATINLGFDAETVSILSVENNRVLTPKGGDGYYYQSYAQWRSTFTGADNIAMRDPHVIEDADGTRYLVFEASTGTQNYQGEHQIYNWANYGGDAAYNVKSLFAILNNADMYERAKFANAAIGILKLTGSEKMPVVKEYYTPLVSATMVSDEIERPNVVKLGDKYYLFAASRLNHGSNNPAWNLANTVVGDNVVMLGYVSDRLTSGYQPLNGSGAVLTASVPADWRTATYSYYAVPVEGSSDTLLVTAYMTNRNEVAGKGKNSTWAPSFLIQILPDNTTRVLAKMTEQGDWIWDETSETKATTGTFDTSYLPGENDGYIDWSGIGGYGLKPHDPYYPVTPNQPSIPDVPNNPDKPGTPLSPKETPSFPPRATRTQTASMLPNTGEASTVPEVVGLVAASVLGLLGVSTYKRKH